MSSSFRRSPILDILAEREQRNAKDRTRLSVEDQLLIVWGTYKGWNRKRIAEKIPASRTTVWRHQRLWEEEPTLLLDLPILAQLSESRFRCEICGETRKTGTKIYRHVLAHVVPDDIARFTSLKEYKRL